VISTDPSAAIHIRGGLVVFEGCYQLFINSTLKFSCGQLEEKKYIKIHNPLGHKQIAIMYKAETVWNVSFLSWDAE
jgi:hypothetical protein